MLNGPFNGSMLNLMTTACGWNCELYEFCLEKEGYVANIFNELTEMSEDGIFFVDSKLYVFRWGKTIIKIALFGKQKCITKSHEYSLKHTDIQSLSK